MSAALFPEAIPLRKEEVTNRTTQLHPIGWHLEGFRPWIPQLQTEHFEPSACGAAFTHLLAGGVFSSFQKMLLRSRERYLRAMMFQFRTMANRSTVNFLESRSMTNKDSESGASPSISDKALAFRDKKSKSPIVKHRRIKGPPQSPDPAKQETNQNTPETPRSGDSVVSKNFTFVKVNEATKAETPASKQESVRARKEKRAPAFRDEKSKNVIFHRHQPNGSPQPPDPAKQEAIQNPPEAPLSIASVAMKNSQCMMVNEATRAETPASKQESVRARKEKRALAKVEKNIAEIQKWYDVGKKLADECRAFAPGGLIEKQAEELGIRAGIARDYRQMSNLYTQAELDTLYQKFRENLCALTISHIRDLVSVKDRPAREAIALDAVQGGWSVRQLHKQKQQRFGKQNINAGRTPKNIKGEGPSALIDAVKSELTKWLRWLDLLLKKHKEIQSPLQDPLKVLLDQIKGVHELSHEKFEQENVS